MQKIWIALTTIVKHIRIGLHIRGATSGVSGVSYSRASPQTHASYKVFGISTQRIESVQKIQVAFTTIRKYIRVGLHIREASVVASGVAALFLAAVHCTPASVLIHAATIVTASFQR